MTLAQIMALVEEDNDSQRRGQRRARNGQQTAPAQPASLADLKQWITRATPSEDA